VGNRLLEPARRILLTVGLPPQCLQLAAAGVGYYSPHHRADEKSRHGSLTKALEDASRLAALHPLGCRCAQSYFFRHPVPTEQLPEPLCVAYNEQS
jgi:hypothetical protein